MFCLKFHNDCTDGISLSWQIIWPQPYSYQFSVKLLDKLDHKLDHKYASGISEKNPLKCVKRAKLMEQHTGNVFGYLT